jgi:hypothetical protein
MRGVIAIVVAGLGVKQNGQAGAVEHQPRHESAEQAAGKGNLIHRSGMRPDQFVVPASELGARKFGGDALTQIVGEAPGLLWIIIDVSVINRN